MFLRTMIAVSLSSLIFAGCEKGGSDKRDPQPPRENPEQVEEKVAEKPAEEVKTIIDQSSKPAEEKKPEVVEKEGEGEETSTETETETETEVEGPSDEEILAAVDIAGKSYFLCFTFNGVQYVENWTFSDSMLEVLSFQSAECKISKSVSSYVYNYNLMVEDKKPRLHTWFDMGGGIIRNSYFNLSNIDENGFTGHINSKSSFDAKKIDHAGIYRYDYHEEASETLILGGDNEIQMNGIDPNTGEAYEYYSKYELKSAATYDYLQFDQIVSGYDSAHVRFKAASLELKWSEFLTYTKISEL